MFRVTVAQLALREGQVRCGHCRAVFDANDHFVSLDAAPAGDEFDTSDELLMGRPTVTLRSADALRPIEESNEVRASADAGAKDEQRTEARDASSPAEAAHDDTPPSAATVERQPKERDVDESADVDVQSANTTKTIEAANATASEDETSTDDASDNATTVEHAARSDEVRASTSRVATEITAEDDAATSTGDTPSAAILGGDESLAHAKDEPHAEVASIDLVRPGPSTRFEWKKRRTTDGSKRKLLVVAAVALAAAIVLQGMLEFRDSLAARVPGMRPLLEAACFAIGCTIGPLRDGGALSIDASDLQADPAHRGLLLLSATIRNRSSHAIAYPLLELTLTNSSDQVVARRAFTPAEYAGGTADMAAGIPANGERVVRMFLDASATQQAGYRLYLFYP